MKKAIAIIGTVFLLFGCFQDADDNITPKQEDYIPIPLEVEIPSNFPDLEYDLKNNPVTQAGFELGKALFYDGRLSSNNAIPCAFCHEQEFAFTHHEHNLSHGVDGKIGLRNSLPMQNLGFQKEYMWDGAASHLDLQPIIPLTSEVEMNEDIENIVNKLKDDTYYKKQFRYAFNGEGVNAENILKALSQFMVMMISADSKYDKYVRKEDSVRLAKIELDGLNTFKAKCASCHATDLFTDQTYRNTGLSVNKRLNDLGRYNILKIEADKYKFKVPSLRNVEKSKPYMHDGRFYSLKAVLDFYDSGMVENGGIVDESLKREDGTLGITLTDYEKESLIAFLKTLTDNQFLTDERFAEF